MKKYEFKYTVVYTKYTVTIEHDTLNRAIVFFGTHYQADILHSVIELK